ncbi:hypothetical protein MmTuc01_3039 [Methanosarcina mazei Tuc01]|uniref:Uncharacterized protein n=1 Tax=Methanosarcina mazei Tuc01 TaxID=1236903 RepID=M1QDH0_METMZ|nr:hypothetical protein MmTuc01_3039 [Methanosarcina mazei Tuc01]
MYPADGKIDKGTGCQMSNFSRENRGIKTIRMLGYKTKV